jgi:hypothetical protein
MFFFSTTLINCDSSVLRFLRHGLSSRGFPPPWTTMSNLLRCQVQCCQGTGPALPGTVMSRDRARSVRYSVVKGQDPLCQV